MTVDVLLRVILTPDPEIKADIRDNDMLTDLKTYLRLKEQDHTLQCNATKIAIDSYLIQVVRLDR